MRLSAERGSRFLVHVGYAAMLVGGVDLMEGSLLILPGGALVAAGTYLDPAARRFLAHRLWVLLLLAVGIGAMFGLSAFGGVGGKSGLSWAWALLVVPYVVGWPLGILGRGVPRWVNYGGVIVGLWLLAIPAIMIFTVLQRPNSTRPFLPLVMITVAALGLVVAIGCFRRVRARAVAPPAG